MKRESRKISDDASLSIASATHTPPWLSRLLLPQWFILAALVVASVVYINGLQNEFVWDDFTLIMDNPCLEAAHPASAVISEPLFVPKYGYSRATTYRPLQTLLYKAAVSLWGKNPPWFRAVSIALHTANAILLFFILRSLAVHPLAAVFVPLLFLVHTVNVAAVTYISGVADPLSAFFLFAGLLWTVRCMINGPTRFLPLHFFGISGLYLCGLLSRESAIFVPVIAGFFLMPIFKEKLYRLWPLLIALACTMVVYVLIRANMISHLNFVPEKPPDSALSFAILVLPFICFKYIYHLLVPIGLTMEYKIVADEANLPLFKFYWLPFLAAVGCIFAFTRDRRSRAFLYLFVLALVPMLNIFVYLNGTMADHWLYVAQIGFFGFLTHALGARADRERWPRGVFFIPAVFLLFVSFQTVQYNAVWKNEGCLFSWFVNSGGANSRSFANLALIRLREGKLEEALKLTDRSIEASPRADAYATRSAIFREMHRDAEAIEPLRKSLELDSTDPDNWADLAALYLKAGEKQKSIECSNKALAILPNFRYAKKVLTAARSI